MSLGVGGHGCPVGRPVASMNWGPVTWPGLSLGQLGATTDLLTRGVL